MGHPLWLNFLTAIILIVRLGTQKVIVEKRLLYKQSASFVVLNFKDMQRKQVQLVIRVLDMLT